MKKDRLLENDIGKYYRVEDGGFWMIGRIESVKDESTDGVMRSYTTYLTSGKEFMINSQWSYNDGAKRAYREATEEEIYWLLACIKADKYIPQPEYCPPIPLIFN